MHVKHCFFFLVCSTIEATLNPPHLEHTTGGEESGSSPPSPPPPPSSLISLSLSSFLPHPSSPAPQHQSIQAVKSLVGLQEEGAGCLYSQPDYDKDAQ